MNLWRRLDFRHKALLVLALMQFAGCGFQMYLVHRNNALRDEIQGTMRKVAVASQQLTKRSEQIKKDTEYLERLLKMLPPKPVPDLRSKL
jgi:hypothetical protein